MSREWERFIKDFRDINIDVTAGADFSFNNVAKIIPIKIFIDIIGSISSINNKLLGNGIKPVLEIAPKI